MALIGTIRNVGRSIVPVSLREKRRDNRRRARLDSVKGSVSDSLSKISSLTRQQCTDPQFIEHELIPALGLNNEFLSHQPPELAHIYGTGLHIWQYPNQLADYLVWIAKNCAGIKSYMEIGCRWGGMFILTSEWLRKNGADLKFAIAIDPIEPSPLIHTYFKILRDQRDIKASYVRDFSSSAKVKEVIDRANPEYVFIDGDHSLKGVLSDHILVRNCAKIIAHHDICSPIVCPDTTYFWSVMKELESDTFDLSQFVDQYESVPGEYLGLGVMKRKTDIPLALNRNAEQPRHD
jgi:hypothetical protein